MRNQTFGTAASALAIIVMLFAANPASAEENGLIVKKSDFDVAKTLDRLGIALDRAGVKVFARIDHAEGAKGAGMELAPTAVVIFGSPKLGTPLMTSNPAIGLDLPLKAVAWQAKDGTVNLAYTDPEWLAKRYGIADRPEVFRKMSEVLAKFTDMATKRGALPNS